MKLLEENTKEVLMLYSQTGDEGKQVLKTLFGRETFEVDLWNKIKSFEDGLAHKGLIAEDVLPNVAHFMSGHREFFHAIAKLVFLADIFRNGWVADYTNENQYKYWPWFIHKSGSGLSFNDSDSVRSLTYIAARLCFPTEEMSTKFGKQFLSIYKPFLLY